MIPKTIHYCWFGRNPLPESARKCIDSWKRFFPDYQIKEWNEDNFDVECLPYVRDAYQAKKYAFVSDYARFWILYHHGGVYFDVDVEVIRSFDDILSKGPFWGIETETGASGKPLVNPGLGIASGPGEELYATILKKYETLPFYVPDGSVSSYTMIPMISDLFFEMGLKGDGSVECLGGHYFYPRDYFNPLDSFTGRLCKTTNTRSIHWYMASWLPPEPAWKKKAKQIFHRIFGAGLSQRIRKLIS